MVATMSQMLNFCEGMRGLCRDMLWLLPSETENTVYRKDFLSFGTKRTTLEQFLKAVIYNLIPDMLRDLHTSKYKRPPNKSDDACFCGYQQNEMKLARASTSIFLKARKHLMETRLYIHIPKTKWACHCKKNIIWLTDSNVSLSSQIKKRQIFLKMYGK